jgi:hypothetical protein
MTETSIITIILMTRMITRVELRGSTTTVTMTTTTTTIADDDADRPRLIMRKSSKSIIIQSYHTLLVGLLLCFDRVMDTSCFYSIYICWFLRNLYCMTHIMDCGTTMFTRRDFVAALYGLMGQFMGCIMI